MEFTRPTTQSEMYKTLKAIFNYYRLSKPEMEDLTLKPLDLTPMTFTALTEEQLRVRAKEIVNFEKKKLYEERNAELERIIDLNVKASSVYAIQEEKRKEEIEQLYEKAKDDAIKEAVKRGVADSTIVANIIEKLTNSKNQEIVDCENEFLEKTIKVNSAETSAKIEQYMLEERLEGIFTIKEEIVFNELKQEQEKIIREVFKYNNLLDEKKQRYDNTITQINANLKLKYMEIKSENLTKDQLIEMGYYQDVINCVCGYYDTLEPLEAYRAISADKTIVVYLEDYYEDMLYMYRAKLDFA